MSLLIPAGELTLTDKIKSRNAAQQAGIDRAVHLNVARGRDELVIRHALPVADWGVAINFWATPALAAITTAYSVFQGVANPVLGARQLAVFYKVTVLTAPIPVNILAFRLGAAAGTTKAIFDLEQLEGELIPTGYFDKPVVYDPGDVLDVTIVSVIATAAICRIPLGCYIFEATQVTIS